MDMTGPEYAAAKAAAIRASRRKPPDLTALPDARQLSDQELEKVRADVLRLGGRPNHPFRRTKP
jgi:hypothetical protein